MDELTKPVMNEQEFSRFIGNVVYTAGMQEDVADLMQWRPDFTVLEDWGAHIQKVLATYGFKVVEL